jgi:hypothetical protein
MAHDMRTFTMFWYGEILGIGNFGRYELQAHFSAAPRCTAALPCLPFISPLKWFGHSAAPRTPSSLYVAINLHRGCNRMNTVWASSVIISPTVFYGLYLQANFCSAYGKDTEYSSAIYSRVFCGKRHLEMVQSQVNGKKNILFRCNFLALLPLSPYLSVCQGWRRAQCPHMQESLSVVVECIVETTNSTRKDPSMRSPTRHYFEAAHERTKTPY